MRQTVSGDIASIIELKSVKDWTLVKRVCYTGFSPLFYDRHSFFSLLNELAIKQVTIDPLREYHVVDSTV